MYHSRVAQLWDTYRSVFVVVQFVVDVARKIVMGCLYSCKCKHQRLQNVLTTGISLMWYFLPRKATEDCKLVVTYKMQCIDKLNQQCSKLALPKFQ